ncbi:uncharacterized protein SPSC_00963 [Sporisorium scitamineum]|uniref:Uncharacterized protein n=1 Tax=Sporisorium scitamineum TaxID=49012 RepID=A0A0F7S782_9BASI|nr:uncharacterized protein SPSC_00963 [Sporisorium scitamineum]CDW96171.1 hypothetical protein [Sporisorium scitamineum]
MVSTRLTRRPEPEPSIRTSRSKAAAARAQPSSSSAKTSRSHQSDENAPAGWRVFVDIENVVTDRKAPVETRSSRRKPLSDRNAPVPTAASLASDKAKKARQSRDEDADFENMFMMSTQSRTSRRSAEPRSVSAPREAGPGSRRARPLQNERSHRTGIQSISESKEEDPLSAQIEAADRRARRALPSHDELTRLSPGLDSDDLEYFDVSTLQQPTQSAQVAPKTAKRNQAPVSEDKDSDGNVSPSQGSHGSSDKENVPPPAALSRTRVSNRTTTRTRAGVLGAIEEDQPTHSTPIASKRQAAKGQASKFTYLDDVFLDMSNHSSQAASPGVARRTEPLLESTQELLDYRERGVSKVMAWKAAGHDETRKARHDSPSPERDDSSAASWPSRDDSGVAADDHERDTDGDELDEFGFFTAEHKMRARREQTRAEFSEGPEPLEDDDSNVFPDIPTDPLVNTTSDDRRLAEQAFGLMSSPAIHRRLASSPVAEPSSVVSIGDQKREAAQRSEAIEDEDAQTKVKVEAEVSKRVTRGSTKRKSDAAAAGSREAAEDDSAPSDLSLELSPLKVNTRAAKARKSTSGIPLKKNAKKEKAVLEKLAADSLSSPASSDASYSPRADRTTKKKADSPAAKKLRMDDILGLLPPRKRNTSNAKSKASQSKKKTTTSTRKGKAASEERASSSKAGTQSKAKRAKARTARYDEDSDESFGEQITKRKLKRSTVSKAKKGKARAEPDSSEEDRWLQDVTSSQIHSDDSERTRRLKEFRSMEKYQMEVEDVL